MTRHATAKHLHSVEKAAEEKGKQVSAFAADALKQVKDFLPEESRRTAGIAGLGALALVATYFLGRSRTRAKELPTQIGNVDVTPIFKFVKLWMLYRIRV